MERLALFERALQQVGTLRGRHPSLQFVESLARQLEYLIAVESGRNPDRSKLKDVFVGYIAARELEGFDDELAALLMDVSSAVETMQ